MANKLNTLVLFFFIFLCFTIISCNNSIKANANLQGKWEIINASRNGRNTLTLEKGYFEFWNNDSIETNILGEILKTNYELKNNIIFTSSELSTISVVKAKLDTIFLETEISNYLFSFTLVKNIR
jgi:hypothetical protein